VYVEHGYTTFIEQGVTILV